VNDNFGRINGLVYGYQDYAALPGVENAPAAGGARRIVGRLATGLLNVGIQFEEGRMTPPVLGFVVPWFGEGVRGGAELQGWETARELARRGVRVEILTTCSRSFLQPLDENHHPAGVSEREGDHRSPLPRRSARRGALSPRQRVLLGGGPRARRSKRTSSARTSNSSELYASSGRTPSATSSSSRRIFTERRSPASAVRPDRSLLIPCLHDESYAYLGVTRRTFLACAARCSSPPRRPRSPVRPAAASQPGG